MGLLLGPGAYYAETTEGAHILSHEGEFALTGRSVYRLLDRLAPALDGRYTLAELTTQLSPDHRSMVRDLVTALIERRVITDTEPASAALSEYQNIPTLVLGTGELGAAVAAAAARSGLRDVHVVTTSEETDQAIESLLEGIQLVLHATDYAVIRRARLLDRLCAGRDIRLAQAIVISGHAWMTNDGWTAGWRRVEARGPEFPSEPAPGPISATAVANQLVHGAFRAITQPAESGRGRMVRINLSTLDSETATVLPHPYAVAAEPGTDLVDRIADLRYGSRLTDEEFSQRAAVCAGDLAGVFGEPTEREFAQLPLHVCAIEVTDPVGLLHPGRPAPMVTGAGLDFATARLAAARRAFACYGSLMIDPRRLEGIEATADPDDLLLALRWGKVTGSVRGYGLADGARHLVDAQRVFPALGPVGRAYTPPPGVAAGYDWDEAVTAGLVGQCRQLTIRRIAASSNPFPRIDLAAAALDHRGDRYRALLAAIGLPVTVYDVTGPLGVPTMLGYLGSVAAGCASSLSRADALAETLQEMLLHHQAQANRQSDYAPPPAPGIPPALRGTGSVPMASDPTAASVISALVAHGHQPIAVPLDHDREVHALMPYTVHVVI